MPKWHEWQTSRNADVNSWLITENEDFFLFALKDAPLDWHSLEKIHNSYKRLEWLASRLLVWQTCQTIPFKDEYGKPYLLGKTHESISITHTKNMVALIKSPYSCGIDAEWVSDRARKVKHKFLSPQELTHFQQASDTVLTVLWSIKEALYKLNGKPNIEFKKHLHIDFFEENNPQKTCTAHLLQPQTGEMTSYQIEYHLFHTDSFAEAFIIVTAEPMFCS